MATYILFIAELVAYLAVPFVYWIGNQSAKIASYMIALIAAFDFALISTTIPTILTGVNHIYQDQPVLNWIPSLNATFSLFVDGVSVSLVMVALLLVMAAVLYSPQYFGKKHNKDGAFYALFMLLSASLIGIFITSNLFLFYINWEFMLIPGYLIIGYWGYNKPFKAAFKFFVFTQTGAVFILIGIGAVYFLTNSVDMFSVRALLMGKDANTLEWILIAFTGGFAVKMAIFPVHIWLPDTYSDAPAPMSVLLSGIMTAAGAYAILRISLMTVLPSILASMPNWGIIFLHGLAIFGLITAFFGGLIAITQDDIKKILSYSSISQMGYILFGLSLYPIVSIGLIPTVPQTIGIMGAVFQIMANSLGKGVLFLSTGAIMRQVESRDIKELGGLGPQMPYTAGSSIIAALSLAGVPPFAAFFSELFIFTGAFEKVTVDSFYFWPTILLLIVTLLSLAYVLRYIARVFYGKPKADDVKEVTFSMKFPIIFLAVLLVVIGIWPTLFVQLITSAFTVIW